MNRLVAAEWLDELPPADRLAIGSRRDLRLLNFFMGNRAQMQNSLLKLFPEKPPRRLVELGAGDGTFLLGLARMLRRRWQGLEVTLVDRQPAISSAIRRGIEECGWTAKIATADVFDWLATERQFDCVITNLFLHHFSPAELARLLTLISGSTAGFVSCEPRRSTAGLFTGRLLWLIGCNSITRHDAPISVRAGFRAHELSALWPRDGWQLRESRAGLFTHLFTAKKLVP
ncbi:MAG TPA: methyltransferase domain-containing protein [Verrucomicrobiae bacterium]|jgi:SAM-dependent methyltransferase|nr:methyltransferase domain-containing protein [Verrucomicrobiae bacterium]